MAPQSQESPPPQSPAPSGSAPTTGDTPTQSSGPPALSTSSPPPPPASTSSSPPPPPPPPPPPTSTSSPPPTPPPQQTSSNTSSNSAQPSPSQSPPSQSTSSTASDASSQSSSTFTSSSSSGPSPSVSSTPSLTPSDTSTSAPPQVSSYTPLSTSVFVSRSGGRIITVTSVVPVSGAPSPTDLNAQGRTSSKSFFDNKGAVAGVFAAVGVVGVVILILLLTNAVRRRQAKRFDREVAEAAREAAAAGHAHGPNMDDDEDFGYNLNHSVYTGDSHGTYSQQPLQPVGMESYNMSELHQPSFDPYAPSVNGANAAGIGAAGISQSKSLTTPYNAFATPAGSVEGQHHSPSHIPMPITSDPFYNPGSSMPMSMPAPSSNYPGMDMGVYGQPQAPPQPVYDRQASLLEAAGLTSGAAVANGAAVRRGQSRSTNDSLSRNRSVGGMSGSDHAHEMYGTSARHDSVSGHGHGQGQGSATYAQTQPYMQVAPANARPYPEPYHPQQQGRPVSMAVSTISGEDPYAAYEEQPGSPVRDVLQTSVHGHQLAHIDDDGEYVEYPAYQAATRDSLASIRDEDDYGYGGGRRVLKVANE